MAGASTAPLDLSTPLEISYDSAAQSALQDVVHGSIFGYAVVKHGTLVAEYYQPGMDEATTSQVFSLTKSVVSVLVLRMVQEGVLNLTTTLHEVWPTSALDWRQVWDAEVKQGVSIRELLTMTSGLLNRWNWFMFEQNTVVEALNHAEYVTAERGHFHYNIEVCALCVAPHA